MLFVERCPIAILRTSHLWLDHSLVTVTLEPSSRNAAYDRLTFRLISIYQRLVM